MDNTYWAKGGDSPAWPVDNDGQRQRAVLLRHTFDSAAEADMTISLLAAYGIPCFPFYDGEGVTGKVISGFSGFGAALYVPQSMHDEALDLLKAEIVDDTDEQKEDCLP